MGNNKINQYLIPPRIDLTKKKTVLKNETEITENNSEEFKNLLQENINKVKEEHGIQISLHAAKRLNERDIGIDSEEFYRLKDAISKLKTKGGQESLVVTDKAAYIIDVPNNRIVTAMDKEKLNGSVFTQIDSTIIVN